MFMFIYYFFFSQKGVETGVDIAKLIKVGTWISEKLHKKNESKVGLATENKSRLLL